MQARSVQKRRSGAVTVESAIIFPVFLILVVGAMDLGIAIFRHHVISQAARAVARQSIVHGSEADSLGSWGPSPVGPVPATDSDPLVNAVRENIAGMDLSEVQVQAEWLDNGNDPGDRVKVTLTAQYSPVLVLVFGADPIVLQASSVMTITH